MNISSTQTQSSASILAWLASRPELADQLPPLALDVIQKTVQKAIEWKLPESALVAIQITPLLHNNLITPAALANLVTPEALDMALQVLKWRPENMQPSRPERPPRSPEYYSQRLRQLVRMIYTDQTNAQLPLIIMAQHNAHLEIMKNPNVIQETEQIFILLAEILGLWRLRRNWVETVSLYNYQSSPKSMLEYQKVIQLIGSEQWYSLDGIRSKLRKAYQYRRETPAASSEHQHWLDTNKTHLKRTEAFIRLRQKIWAACKNTGMQHRPLVTIRQAPPGGIIKRARQGENIEDQIYRLRIRIFCQTENECYQILGIIHQLGKPVAPRYSERFEDFIAAPQSNGYRSIHTAMSFKWVDRDHKTNEILVDCRIVTKAMHAINENGIQAAKFGFPGADKGINTWWNRLPELSERLNTLRKAKEHTTIQDYIAKHELNTQSDPLYVITPKGDIILMEKGSTPLDFAYMIHTEIGHHALKAEVNSRTVPFNYPLRNGDMVKITFSLNNSGLDFSWLNSVQSGRARAKIRRQLSSRAEAIHPGRQLIEEAVSKLEKYYRERRKYTLNITTSRLESFLYRFASEEQKCPVPALYEQIFTEKETNINQPILDRLINHLVSDEFTPIVVDMNGDHLPYPPRQISICPTCRPIPGEPILAVIRQANRHKEQILVHSRLSKVCALKNTSNTLPIRWVEASTPAVETMVFEIDGMDRPRLLYDLLECIYPFRECQVVAVEAQKAVSGNAHVQLIISTTNKDNFSKIHEELDQVRGLRRILTKNASIAQILAHSTPKNNLYDPFWEQEVRNRLGFYDREELLSKIMQWLKDVQGSVLQSEERFGRPLSNWAILHGQRRVGKSSAAQFLIHEELISDPSIQPCALTMQSLSYFSPQAIADHLGAQICEQLHMDIPAQEVWEQPFSWLKRVLNKIVEEQPSKLILVVIDEFTVLLDRQNAQEMDRMVLSNLAWLFKTVKQVAWLVIVHDSEYLNPARWGAARAIIEKAPDFQILPFDETYTRRLFCEPLQAMGYDLETEEISKQVYDLTGGNPYLIKTLGREVDELLKRHNHIRLTSEELQHASRLIYSDADRYFDHMLVHTHGFNGIVLAAIAQCAGQREWVPYPDLLACLCDECVDQEELVQNALDALETQGVIERQLDAANSQIRIRVGLFRQWASRHLSLTDAIENWQAGE